MPLSDVRPFPVAGEKRTEDHKALRSPANLVGLFAFWAFETALGCGLTEERAGEGGATPVNSSAKHYLGVSHRGTALSQNAAAPIDQDQPAGAAPAGFRLAPRLATRPRPPAAPTDNGRDGTGTAVLTRTRTRKPNLYRVLILNDDYTPMEFVVHVLERFFNKDRAEATRIMMHVHQNGVGECGVFTYEVAETKVTLVMDLARKHMHPLQCVMEKK